MMWKIMTSSFCMCILPTTNRLKHSPMPSRLLVFWPFYLETAYDSLELNDCVAKDLRLYRVEYFTWACHFLSSGPKVNQILQNGLRLILRSCPSYISRDYLAATRLLKGMIEPIFLQDVNRVEWGKTLLRLTTVRECKLVLDPFVSGRSNVWWSLWGCIMAWCVEVSANSYLMK